MAYLRVRKAHNEETKNTAALAWDHFSQWSSSAMTDSCSVISASVRPKSHNLCKLSSNLQGWATADNMEAEYFPGGGATCALQSRPFASMYCKNGRRVRRVNTANEARRRTMSWAGYHGTHVRNQKNEVPPSGVRWERRSDPLSHELRFPESAAWAGLQLVFVQVACLEVSACPCCQAPLLPSSSWLPTWLRVPVQTDSSEEADGKFIEAARSRGWSRVPFHIVKRTLQPWSWNILLQLQMQGAGMNGIEVC